MKILLLLTCLLASGYTYSQFGIKGGANLSYFSMGDKTKSGINLASVGFIGGVYDNIQLGEKTSLEVDLLYVHQGAKTPDVDNRTYSVYSISLPITFSYKIGFLSLKGGGYIDRMLFCKNWDFEGGVYGWSAAVWKYMKRYDYGAVGGINIDFVGASLDLNYKRGLVTVRGKERTSTRYDGCYNSSFSAMLVIPFKTLFYRDTNKRNYGSRQWREPATYSKF